MYFQAPVLPERGLFQTASHLQIGFEFLPDMLIIRGILS